MSRPSKYSIKDNYNIKLKKKLRKFTDKSGHILLKKFIAIIAKIPCTKMYSSVHSQFFVQVVMNVMT